MKIIKRLIALILFLSSCILLFSCLPYGAYKDNYFPDGYTGGFGVGHGSGAAYYWVETYEECKAAIEQLKSHGSTFAQTAIFSYNGDLFDTKYCFSINRKKADKIKYGDNPFDRHAENVHVYAFAFLEDVTIDELIFSHIQFYNAYGFGAEKEFFELYKNNPDIIKLDKSGFAYEEAKNNDRSHYYYVSLNKFTDSMFWLNERCIYKEKQVPLSEAGIEAIAGSVVIVE